MKVCTAVQGGCGYKDTLRAHRYFASLAKYFAVCIIYQPPLVINIEIVIVEAQHCIPCVVYATRITTNTLQFLH
jgi:hypothetical protein